MNDIKPFSRRILLWSFIIMALLAGLFSAAGIAATRFLANIIPFRVLKDASMQSEALKTALEKITPLFQTVHLFYIPAIAVLFLLFTLILWVCLRGSVARFIKESGFPGQPASTERKKAKKDALPPMPSEEPVMSKKEIAETNKRFYLHLVAVLQREGRLIDFFSEDLGAYDDAQIGAAVRSIQENCKNSLNKHLNPKAVMDQNEGDQVTVPAGFDPNAVKLTGNVTGEPPFQGILRHKGWRAARLELPTLSAVKDSAIIAPAEIELT